MWRWSTGNFTSADRHCMWRGESSKCERLLQQDSTCSLGSML